MFGNLGCHIMQFPSERWGYIGSVPRSLGQEVPASTAAVMGCRSYRNAAGEIVETKFPTFESEHEARAYAASCGVDLSN